MNPEISPKRMMLLGMGLMVLGVVLSFLMVLRIVEPSYWLSFLTYAASVIGLIVAFLGLIMYSRKEKQ